MLFRSTSNLTYRWSGTAYVEISPSLALGETSSTAYAGNKGAANAKNIETILTYFDSDGKQRPQYLQYLRLTIQMAKR